LEFLSISHLKFKQMKSRQFTLGLMVLILTELLSFKTVAQCCVAPVNLEPIPECTTPPPEPIICSTAKLQWNRVQEAGCTTPITYKVQWRVVGASVWTNRIVTTNPDATTGFTKTDPPLVCKCRRTYEWRVRGICSDTNKTAWVQGPDFTLTGNPFPISFATSSASAASSQDKFTVAAYPNPVAGELKLLGNLKAGGPVNVQIINSVGQTVVRQDYNFNPGNFSTGIDVSKLPPGVYLVVVNDKTERATLTVLKQ
jgi:hypothetical protein